MVGASTLSGNFGRRHRCEWTLKEKTINFADVVCFDAKKIDSYGNTILFILYNPEESKKKLESQNVILRLFRHGKIYQTGIDISYIDMKAEELCNILNERLPQHFSP